MSTDSIAGHVATLAHSESNPQLATRGPGTVLGSLFPAQVSSSAKWMDQRRKDVRKHFYSITSKSFQISAVL